MNTRLIKTITIALFLFAVRKDATAQDDLDRLLPVRGFCIEAPQAKGLDAFIAFVNEGLAPRHVNTLILRVDYNYQYESHPEVRDGTGLSKADVKKLVEACRTNHIRLIPQINLLGHQSWAKTTFGLLRSHPEFDETPQVKTENYTNWPNSDALYCKSYCPLHPELHAIVFDLIDEVCDAFETDAFHAGMDEVFYLGHDKCPRCSGRDKAELFAGEVRTLRDHLAQKNRQLWIWGDRFIDGKTTGIGEWEASYNNTYRAIDMVPKDIMICDWHYDRPDQTPVYFAMKGLNVITCPWRNPKFAVLQTQDMVKFRNSASKEMKPRYQGMMQTVWSGAGGFLENDYKGNGTNANNPWTTFKAMSDEWEKLNNAHAAKEN